MSLNPCVCAFVHGLLWKLPTKTVAHNRRRKHSTSTSAHKTDICSEIHSQQSSESHFQNQYNSFNNENDIKYHSLCALHNLTSSGSSPRLLRCSFQDPSCGGGEVTANGGCSAGGRSAAAPPSLCLWPLLQLLRLRLHHHRHCPVLQ